MLTDHNGAHIVLVCSLEEPFLMRFVAEDPGVVPQLVEKVAEARIAVSAIDPPRFNSLDALDQLVKVSVIAQRNRFVDSKPIFGARVKRPTRDGDFNTTSR